MSEKVISVTAALRNFGALVERTEKRRESTLLLRHGKPVARLVPVEGRAKTGKELAKSWSKRFHLSREEAGDFETDTAGARRKLTPLKSPEWE